MAKKIDFYCKAYIAANGDLEYGPLRGVGQNRRIFPTKLDLSNLNPPVTAEELLRSTMPIRLVQLGVPHAMYLWLCRDNVVFVHDDTLTEDEKRLEVANLVLKREQRYERLQRQIDAYTQFEETEAARRERLPDSVKLFVWQRDEGECVRCGSNQRLEFDHVIPVNEGGSNTERNIQLLCETCNRQKGGHL